MIYHCHVFFYHSGLGYVIRNNVKIGAGMFKCSYWFERYLQKTRGESYNWQKCSYRYRGDSFLEYYNR